MSRLLRWLGRDPRRTSEEAQRNHAAIARVMERAVHPASMEGRALELGSGSGEHVLAWAARFPRVVWQPSDPDPVQRRSIDAWCDGRSNVRPAIHLDGTRSPYRVDGPLQSIVAVHVLHIAPPALVDVLFAESRRLLAPGGLVVVHDAFLDDGDHAPSERMRDFHARLRARSGGQGLRPRARVDRAAREAGLELSIDAIHDGDQRTLAYRKPGGGA